jgi:hypothetical protein
MINDNKKPDRDDVDGLDATLRSGMAQNKPLWQIKEDEREKDKPGHKR